MKYIISSLFVVLVAAVILVSTQAVKANPSYFIFSNTNATTSVSYLTPGTGTTTEVFDTLQSGYAPSMDAILTYQFTASSTGAVLKFRLEYSQNGYDWFTSLNALTTSATTTVLSGSAAEYQVSIATTTDFGGSGTDSRIYQSLQVEVPTRYIRAKFYLAGAVNGSLWSQFIGQKQNR